MKICIFSVGPVFPNHVHGGSQKILRELAIHFGSVGHEVRVLCTRRPDNDTPFQLAANVDVLPTLRLKPIYPEPYYTAPHNISHLIHEVKRNVEDSDVFYIHDAELPFHDLNCRTPTVVSFRDFVYPDTLVGAFGFRRDELILSCEYVASCVRDAFAQILPDIMSRTHVVPNGINLSHFRPVRPEKMDSELAALLGELPPADYTLLYPHRPDRRKGILECVAIAAEVQRRLSSQGKTIRLLIPRWIDSTVASESLHEYQSIYSEALSSAENLGIAERVHVHDWVPYAQMPEYLSLGDVTLSVGNFVEAFGNVHLESVACGTPAVVSMVAAHAHNLPEPIVRKVAYGDIPASAHAVIRSCVESFDFNSARTYLAKNFSFPAMLAGYERILTSATVKTPLKLRSLDSVNSHGWVRLAAWCRHDGHGIYNDYAYGRISQTRRINLALAARQAVRVSCLENSGFSLAEIAREIDDGVLVQLNHDGQAMEHF